MVTRSIKINLLILTLFYDQYNKPDFSTSEIELRLLGSILFFGSKIRSKLGLKTIGGFQSGDGQDPQNFQSLDKSPTNAFINKLIVELQIDCRHF